MFPSRWSLRETILLLVLPFLTIFFWSFLWHCSGKSFGYFNHSLFLTKNGFTRLTLHLSDLTSSGSWPVLKKRIYSQRIKVPKHWDDFFLMPQPLWKQFQNTSFPVIFWKNYIFTIPDWLICPKMTTLRCQCFGDGKVIHYGLMKSLNKDCEIDWFYIPVKTTKSLLEDRFSSTI